MSWSKRKKNKPRKVIDGLKRSNLYNAKRPFKKNVLDFAKPLKVAFIVICSVILLFIILYLIPQTRSRIDLVRMFWNGKYLILFQNNAEIRSTGGFIGSFAVIDIKYGRITNTYFDTNIYKRDNEFSRKFKVEVQDPILADFVPESGLAMRDSNWALDFSQAAQQVAWFYEQEGGTKVDGVIAIDTEFFKNLLNVIGNISMPKYNITINVNNFLEETQYKIEKEYFSDSANKGVDEPKSILADMMPIVLTRIKNSHNWSKLYSFIKDQLKQKHLLLYSYNSSIQSTIVDNNFGGTVPDSNFDYIYFNNNNLGANKTSVYVYEQFDINIEKTSDKIIHNLTITRQYPEIDINSRAFLELDNLSNFNYTRILISNSSTQIEVQNDNKDIGQDLSITQEAGKTKLGFWSTVDFGKTIIIKIHYEIPVDQINDKYLLYLQKQPGAINQNITITINEQVKYDDEFDYDLEI